MNILPVNRSDIVGVVCSSDLRQLPQHFYYSELERCILLI